jgi:hypothetical protein
LPIDSVGDVDGKRKSQGERDEAAHEKRTKDRTTFLSR